jgi:hypothetical protein
MLLSFFGEQHRLLKIRLIPPVGCLTGGFPRSLLAVVFADGFDAVHVLSSVTGCREPQQLYIIVT